MDTNAGGHNRGNSPPVESPEKYDNESHGMYGTCALSETWNLTESVSRHLI